MCLPIRVSGRASTSLPTRAAKSTSRSANPSGLTAYSPRGHCPFFQLAICILQFAFCNFLLRRGRLDGPQREDAVALVAVDHREAVRQEAAVHGLVVREVDLARVGVLADLGLEAEQRL